VVRTSSGTAGTSIATANFYVYSCLCLLLSTVTWEYFRILIPLIRRCFAPVICTSIQRYVFASSFYLRAKRNKRKGLNIATHLACFNMADMSFDPLEGEY